MFFWKKKSEARIEENREWKKSFNWVRLIDDTFMNWTESEPRFAEFFAFLNSLYPPIKWSMEKEKKGKFHVLTPNSSEQQQKLIQPSIENPQLQIDFFIIRLLRLGMRKPHPSTR